jgi:hypothetical protein
MMKEKMRKGEDLERKSSRRKVRQETRLRN